MQNNLNGAKISKVHKFLADNPSETTYAIQVSDPLNAAHLLIIQLKLQGVRNYFDLQFLSIEE